MMEASERLLNLESHDLKVFYASDKIAVKFVDGDIEDGVIRKSTFGIGHTFEEACEDYLEKISGKTLIFGYGDEREEIKVL